MVDVLVIGAGPSGCVAASYLHDRGYNVKVVEKSKFPRFVIGESLLPRCMDHFEQSGLLDCLKAKKFEVKTGVRFVKGNNICEFDFSYKHTEGWDWTWQVPRAEFDNTLAKEVASKGVDISFEQEVIDVQFNDAFSETFIKDKEGKITKVRAKFIVDSSGFGRVLPRLLNLEKPGAITGNASIFTHITDSKRPSGKDGKVFAFDVINTETWFWVIPFSNGTTSIGFVGPSEFIDSFKGSNEEVLAQMLKLSEYSYERFKDIDFQFKPVKVKFSSKSVTNLYGKGYAITGNSAEFIDPLFASGVTFATESALLAAKLISKELVGKTVDWENDYTKYLKDGIGVFSSFVKEWYSGNLQKLFFDETAEEKTKKQISSVLAGYVWDQTNPFVTKHDRIIKGIAHFIEKKNRRKELMAMR